MAFMNTFGTAAAMTAATECGLVQALAQGDRGTADELAARLELDPRATSRVLDVLVAVEIASRDGESYQASEELTYYATRGPMGVAGLQLLWGHTTSFLRDGSALLLPRKANRPKDRDRVYKGAVGYLKSLFAPNALAFAESFAADPPRERRVLDVGCGSGIWSLSLAKRDPGVRVTGLDMPHVLEAFRACSAELGVDDRTTTLAGSMYDVDLEAGGYDLIVLANVLHLETPERAAVLLRRLRDALAQDGELVLIETLPPAPNPAAAHTVAIYALHLSMRVATGQVYSAVEARAMLEGAGFVVDEDLTALPGDVPVMSAMRARRE